jgi:hypothetical protein
MQVGNIRFHRRALFAFQQLDADEQSQVRERLLSLDATPVAQWPVDLARRLPGDQPRYLVCLNDSLRAFVQVVEGQQPEVQDIVNQGLLDWMAQTAPKKGA